MIQIIPEALKPNLYTDVGKPHGYLYYTSETGSRSDAYINKRERGKMS